MVVFSTCNMIHSEPTLVDRPKLRWRNGDEEMEVCENCRKPEQVEKYHHPPPPSTWDQGGKEVLVVMKSKFHVADGGILRALCIDLAYG